MVKQTNKKLLEEIEGFGYFNLEAKISYLWPGQYFVGSLSICRPESPTSKNLAFKFWYVSLSMGGRQWLLVSLFGNWFFKETSEQRKSYDNQVSDVSLWIISYSLDLFPSKFNSLFEHPRFIIFNPCNSRVSVIISLPQPLGKFQFNNHITRHEWIIWCI